MRSDIIKRVLIACSGIALLVYLLVLWNQDVVIVQSMYEQYNLLAHIIIGAAAIYYSFVYGIYPIPVKWNKRTFFVVSLGMILGGYSFLSNDYTQGLYIGDIIRIAGVLLLVFGATGYLTSSKTRKHKEEQDVEIIEV